MSVTPLHPGRVWFSAAVQVLRRCVLIAAGVLVVVVPFGYAASGDHVQVVRGRATVSSSGSGYRFHADWAARTWLGRLVRSVVGLVTIQILADRPPRREAGR
ncbi:MAG: hypothetical protein OXG04_00490 [Acidobacteria bacterium]|nr:hypothetical protein [Acidobacteriota bacterium]